MAIFLFHSKSNAQIKASSPENLMNATHCQNVCSNLGERQDPDTCACSCPDGQEVADSSNACCDSLKIAGEECCTDTQKVVDGRCVECAYRIKIRRLGNEDEKPSGWSTAVYNDPVEMYTGDMQCFKDILNEVAPVVRDKLASAGWGKKSFDNCLANGFLCGTGDCKKTFQNHPKKPYAHGVTDCSTADGLVCCSVYYDSNCNSLEDRPLTSSLCGRTGEVQYYSTPISLLWNGSYEENLTHKVSKFPLDPNMKGKIYS